MHIFLTGATGFIGTHLIPELTQAGHSVLGLARSDAGAQAIAKLGAQVQRGSLEDAASLREGAAKADAVIHAGFNHDFSKFQENCELDRRAIETIGAVLTGSDRPLIVTGGLAGLATPGMPGTEDSIIPADYPFPRVSEQTAIALIPQGVNASVMRLSQIHDTKRQGLLSYIIDIARQKGVSAYIGDGASVWSAAHVLDTARLYRLALERHQTGARWHAVAEEGVSMRDVAETIGRGLGVPAVSITPEEAEAHFGWMSMFVKHGLVGSSAKTRQKLGWHPTGPGMIADLEKVDYAQPLAA